MISKCYADAVDDHLEQICSGGALPSQSVRQLVESGFIVVPGPLSGDPFNELTAAYDEVMAVAAGPDFKIRSTTDSEDAPLLGFILMVDSLREENGATRFVPTSHDWSYLPSERVSDARAKYSGEVLGCGERGSIIIFNGAIWDGHTANAF